MIEMEQVVSLVRRAARSLCAWSWGGWPDSIAARTTLVLVSGLMVAHLLSTAVSLPGHGGSASASDVVLAKQIAAAAVLMEKTESDQRQEMAGRLSSPAIALLWSRDAAFPDQHQDATAEEMKSLRQALEPVLGPLPHERMHLMHREQSSLFTREAVGSGHQHPESGVFVRIAALIHPAAEQQPVQISLRLADQSWLHAGLVLSRPVSLLSWDNILSNLIMGAGAVLFSLLAVRWIERPLETFTGAAERLGRDVQAPPLAEDGPREMRRAVSAFNAMQTRLRSFTEDRTRMLAAISHDLRSPVTRLRLRAERLEDALSREKILQDLQEMEAMMTSVLDFSRTEALDEAPQLTDLAALLETICDDVCQAGLCAEFDWPGRVIYSCRPVALKRALTNLVENAARYGHAAKVMLQQEERCCRITIDDQGGGIPDACLETVFTPFFRLDPSRNRQTGGIGLGLTVARTVLRRQGGDVVLSNRAEGGLRAVVTLPRDGRDRGGA